MCALCREPCDGRIARNLSKNVPIRDDLFKTFFESPRQYPRVHSPKIQPGIAAFAELGPSSPSRQTFDDALYRIPSIGETSPLSESLSACVSAIYRWDQDCLLAVRILFGEATRGSRRCQFSRTRRGGQGEAQELSGLHPPMDHERTMGRAIGILDYHHSGICLLSFDGRKKTSISGCFPSFGPAG